MNAKSVRIVNSVKESFKKLHVLIARLAPQSIIQAYIIVSPIPISICISIQNLIASKRGLDLALLNNYIQNPMDAMVWQKESQAAYSQVMTKIWFESLATVLAGVIVSLILHQVFYARRLASGAKKSPLPASLPPAVATNFTEAIFKDYLRTYEEVSEAGKVNSSLNDVDFFRLSVGRNQFITFRSWPIWMKQHFMAKCLLIGCIALDLILDPSATAVGVGILIALAITSEFVIRNRGYFETEMRKFLTIKKEEGAHPVNLREDDVAEKISRLHVLVKDGALTHEEFEKEKRRILEKVA